MQRGRKAQGGGRDGGMRSQSFPMMSAVKLQNRPPETIFGKIPRSYHNKEKLSCDPAKYGSSAKSYRPQQIFKEPNWNPKQKKSRKYQKFCPIRTLVSSSPKMKTR
jgi:hypothetical protein